jgi:hypothetical protein
MFDTMANIEKRGDTYRITVSNGYDINGKKIREKTTYIPDPDLTPKQQQKAFEKFVFDFEEKVKNGKYLKGEKVTLKDFSDTWLKDYANQQLEKTTFAFYKETLDQKILPALGHLKLSKIQPMHLQSFYNNLLEDGIRKDGKKGGLSPSTIKKCHAIISSILSTAVHWQVLESNPCDRVSPPKDKNVKDDVKHFTLEQTEVGVRSYPRLTVRNGDGHGGAENGIVADNGRPSQGNPGGQPPKELGKQLQTLGAPAFLQDPRPDRHGVSPTRYLNGLHEWLYSA